MALHNINPGGTDWQQEYKDLQAEEVDYELAMVNKIGQAKLSYAKKLAAEQLSIETAGAEKIAKLGLLASKKQLIQEQEAVKKRIANEKLFNKWSDQEAKKRQKATLKNLEARYKQEKKLAEEIVAREKKAAAQKIYAENIAERKLGISSALFGKGIGWGDRLTKLQGSFSGEGGSVKGLDALASAISDISKKLEQSIDAIGARKGAIDTRMQGSKNYRSLSNLSYWDTMSSKIGQIAAVSPLIKQSDIANNLQTMVTSGIAFNVDQRAFLQTIKTKIADTFDATNGTLLRLIRIQQQDSTASRLGMESALNAFLNNMYETSEYLNDVSKSVKSSLEEAMSLMSAQSAVGFEYQVQKWMGSLYSVGMSSGSVQNIASALGQLSSGDVSGLTGTGVGNLLVMAANRANLSIGELLATGLDESNTNQLMQAMVNYLATIAKETSGSRVVQQQLANVYGITASDLRAATNLSTSTGAVSKSTLGYNEGLTRLGVMSGTMYARTGAGELLSNTWENLQYTLASGIANNPALYAIYKVAGLLDAISGGIAIPGISVAGTMVDLETTVADLMRVGALSGSIMSGLGKLMTGGGVSGLGMLAAAGILPGKISTVSRGTGGLFSNLISSGAAISSSGYAGTGSGEDIQQKVISDASASGNKQVIEQQEQEEADIKNKVINENVVNIYTLLQRLVNGSEHLHVVYDLGTNI